MMQGLSDSPFRLCEAGSRVIIDNGRNENFRALKLFHVEHLQFVMALLRRLTIYSRSTLFQTQKHGAVGAVGRVFVFLLKLNGYSNLRQERS